MRLLEASWLQVHAQYVEPISCLRLGVSSIHNICWGLLHGKAAKAVSMSFLAVSAEFYHCPHKADGSGGRGLSRSVLNACYAKQHLVNNEHSVRSNTVCRKYTGFEARKIRLDLNIGSTHYKLYDFEQVIKTFSPKTKCIILWNYYKVRVINLFTWFALF